MRRAIPVLIIVLALAGIADSVYLTLSHYQVLGPTKPLPGDVCVFEKGSCETVTKSPQSTFLGVPFGLAGVAYYGFVLGLAYMKLRNGVWPFASVLWFVFLGALLFSGYLVYVLLFQLGVPCPYCLAAHSINLLVVTLYAVSRVAEHPPRPRYGRWAYGAR